MFRSEPSELSRVAFNLLTGLTALVLLVQVESKVQVSKLMIDTTVCKLTLARESPVRVEFEPG